VRRYPQVAVWLVGTAVLAVFAAAVGLAHAPMTKSVPPNNAVLGASPAVIRAWFGDEVTASGSRLRLYDAHDTLLAAGGRDPKDSSHMVLALVPPPLKPGGYLVRWHVVDANDNHVTEGYFRFTVRGAAMAPSGMVMAMSMPAVPPLALIAPKDHSTVKNPVAVVIETTGNMKQLTMGGMTMSGSSGMSGPAVHLHILVDGVTTMPSSDQLTPAGTHRYRYLLAPLSRGRHTVAVLWADNTTHNPVGPAHSATFTVTQ
jgi:methionine-rich copper-binding protein CopC